MLAPQITSISPFGYKEPATDTDHLTPLCTEFPGRQAGFRTGKQRQLRGSGSGLLQNWKNVVLISYLVWNRSRVFSLGSYLGGTYFSFKAGWLERIQESAPEQGSGGRLELPTPPASSGPQENFHQPLHQNCSVNLDQSLLSPVTSIMTPLHLPLPPGAWQMRGFMEQVPELWWESVSLHCGKNIYPWTAGRDSFIIHLQSYW